MSIELDFVIITITISQEKSSDPSLHPFPISPTSNLALSIQQTCLLPSWEMSSLELHVTLLRCSETEMCSSIIFNEEGSKTYFCFWYWSYLVHLTQSSKWLNFKSQLGKYSYLFSILYSSKGPKLMYLLESSFFCNATTVLCVWIYQQPGSSSTH